MKQNKELLEKILKETYLNKNISFVGECWSSTAFIIDDIIVRFPKKPIDDLA